MRKDAQEFHLRFPEVPVPAVLCRLLQRCYRLVQFAKKRFYLSIFYGKQALALAEEHKLVDHYSMIYSNLAAPYRELGA
jgi:hypothetical protein